MNIAAKIKSGSELRKLIRTGDFAGQTAGQAPDHLQGNVVILPKKHAGDFLLFCLNNPKPCPLIGMSKPGDPSIASLGNEIDIRYDVPRYCIYKNGKLFDEVNDILEYWADDFVTFILGCSFTFEEALMQSGFVVRHIEQGLNVPMFKTNIETMPGGIFKGPLVVTMRPYPKEKIPAVFDLCAEYPHAHGTPVYWGDPISIGINDLQKPDYGDAIEVMEDEVPVFWACGVTPQAAIENAKPELCITHAPGHMLVTDIRSSQHLSVSAQMSAFQN
jgi:uncharacterized protein YcsI (UPF0317 family)